MTNRRLKYQFYRAMIQDLSYYDHLHDLIPRVRRFDYPPPPPNYGALTTNLVVFLNHALTQIPESQASARVARTSSTMAFLRCSIGSTEFSFSYFVNTQVMPIA